jgi:hypothetical protein
MIVAMTKRKTLLTPEEQWKKTAAYLIYSGWSTLEDDTERHLCIFHGTHPLVMDADILVLTCFNGMAMRYGMTGVTSKGARLNNYHLPLRRGFELVVLPDDLSGKQWDDPAMGRYVADLRASRRGRVSAYSPALSNYNCKTLPGIDTNEITCFGLYKSGRTSRSTRKYDYRHYLRFYPDGSVVSTADYNHQGVLISFDPEQLSLGHCDPYTPKGVVHTENGRVTFELSGSKGDVWARYEGYFEHGRLWLSYDNLKEGMFLGSHGKLPYRFHPFNPKAFLRDGCD